MVQYQIQYHAAAWAGDGAQVAMRVAAAVLILLTVAPTAWAARRCTGADDCTVCKTCVAGRDYHLPESRVRTAGAPRVRRGGEAAAR